MEFEKIIVNILKKETKLKEISLEVPPSIELGDYTFPCFQLSNQRKKSPNEIANELAKQIPKEYFIKDIVANGPYLNFFLNYENLIKETLTKISLKKKNFGKQKIGKNKKIVIDFSSPNIAKPFSIGHLRSTVIGNSLYKIHKFLGYKVMGVNHLGDWGTQFGKLILAYKKWGEEQKLKKEPIKYLLKLYIKLHKEIEKNPKLEDQARQEFKKLEEKNKESIKLWRIFKKLSLTEFRKIYDLLDIKFDSYKGESFYNTKSNKTIKKIHKKLKTTLSEGALIIDLKKYKMPPMILIKSNKTSGYHTRDLAAAFYRLKKYNPEKIIYVVGSEQKLHFKQLFKVLDMAKINKEKFAHVDFGLYHFQGGKMSTRKGNIIFVEEVLNKAINLAEKKIQKKNPHLINKKEIAKQIGIGAIIFGDLNNDRTRNIEFDWDKIISLVGETAPYIQYTHARACNIIKKANLKINTKINFSLLNNQQEIKIIKRLHIFPKILREVITDYKPHKLANYLISLSKEFNEFYSHKKVLSNDMDQMKARLLLVSSTKQVLKNGLNLLGIKAPQQM
jgi:arginyl-tRNA synthetase